MNTRARAACSLRWSTGNRYNPRFPELRTVMEAEQLNAIARRLQDLGERNTTIRGYL